jgi:acetoin utilization deacetylase AcuC-like enzyme
VIAAYYDPGFAAPIGPHPMPMEKFALVAAAVRGWPGVRIMAPAPVAEADLLRVHSPAYLAAVRTGEPRALAESQKFPWSPALFPSVCLTNGAVLAAARAAFETGVAAAVASGFHHAQAERGEGFCTFNGLVVAAERLRAEGRVRRVAVLDLDLHYGNGTARLAATRPWLHALSIYGNDYHDNQAYRDVTIRRHVDGANHRSWALPAGCDGGQLQATLAAVLPELIAAGRPDLVLYQAGADPLRDDPYSPLALDHTDLLARDRTVFAFLRAQGLPVAWTLAGGYTPDVRQVVTVHTNTFHAALEVYDRAGDSTG